MAIKIIGFSAFMIIWILSCYLQSKFFHIDIDAYLMGYGAIAFMIGHTLEETINIKLG